MSLWRVSDYHWAAFGIATQADVKDKMADAPAKRVACHVLQRWGRSFDLRIREVILDIPRETHKH